MLSQGDLPDQAPRTSVSFEEFINLMQQVENKILSNNNGGQGQGHHPDMPSTIKKDGGLIPMTGTNFGHQQRGLLASAGGNGGLN